MSQSDPTTTGLNEADEFLRGFSEEDDAIGRGSPPVASAPAGDPPGDGGEPAQGAPTGASDGQPEGVDAPAEGEHGGTQTQGDDLLASLPDDVRQLVMQERARAQELEASLSRERQEKAALHGRLAPVQQRMAQLERELAQSKQQPAQPPQPQAPAAAAAAGSDSEAARGDLQQAEAYYETPDWKEYEELFPEDARRQKEQNLRILRGAVSRAERLEQRLEQLAQSVQPAIQRIEQREAYAAHEAAKQQLAQQHPDWTKYQSDATPEGRQFWEWFLSRQGVYGITGEEDLRRRVNDQTFVSEILTDFKVRHAVAAADHNPSTPAARAPAAAAQLALAAAPAVRGSGPRVSRTSLGQLSEAEAFAAGFNSPD